MDCLSNFSFRFHCCSYKPQNVWGAFLAFTFPKFLNIFIEIKFTYHKIHPFIMYNLDLTISKELGSHHFTLTSKSKKTEKSATLPGSIREGRTEGKLLTPKLERQTGKYSLSQLTGAQTHQQKPPQEPVMG